MTIYNINFGIGWASSGVEYAQAYRAKLLRRTNQDTKFVFLDFIQSENIQTLTQNIGFEDQEVIWLYQYFSDISIAPTTYTLDDIERELGHDISFRERNGKIVRLYFNGKSSFVTCYLQNEQKDIVDRAEFVINSMLVRKDFIVIHAYFLSIMHQLIIKRNYICDNSIMKMAPSLITNILMETALYMCLKMRCCITKRNLLHTFYND
ncbi:Poly(glycerol-phosphate) alpha-glucosyltransferase GftA [Staphylococcus aureus]|uniref:Poly(Glycerol-phosphate) alpha-glucosyltransferase GftA n=1 Tax=Staphylococcus aureus TaxID=1280 RepID=A0A2X2JZ65_STAAU|nr:Poly(glycerol-phosphate) alpha-glucosyltransferase GftA [Staphylococcus aureus]